LLQGYELVIVDISSRFEFFPLDASFIHTSPKRHLSDIEDDRVKVCNKEGATTLALYPLISKYYPAPSS
jgi:hypothetical protein